MICSRCGHSDIPKAASACPNCGFTFKSGSRLTSTTSFRALSARRKLLTSRQYAMPFALGEDAFDQYVIRDLLGQGPLGVVYLVTNDRGDQFALKVLHKRWRSDMDLETLKDNYLNIEDIENGERLNLPVTVLMKDEQIGLLSAHLEGLTVRKLMNLRKNTSKAFRLDELTQLVHGIATPLKVLHRENIAHGGLKPENFFVQADQDQKQIVTLSDSCLSSGLGIELYHKAQRAAGYGHYIAPELSKGKLSSASDVYSLGVFIFEGITGQVYQTKKTIQEIVPAQGIEPLEELIARALHQDPNQRYRDVSALLSAYDDVAKYLDTLDGSPFNSEGTQPRNESMVTRFSITNLEKVMDTEDPLFGEDSTEQKPLHIPPPLPEGAHLPPLPLSSRSNAAESGTFPIQDAVTPSLDPLSRVGQTLERAPSLDSIVSADPSLDRLDHSPLSISVGAPQTLPKPARQDQDKSFGAWIGIAAILCLVGGLYLFMDSNSPSNNPVEVSIKLPTEKPISAVTLDEAKSTIVADDQQAKTNLVEAEAERAKAERAKAERAKAERAKAERAKAERAKTERTKAELETPKEKRSTAKTIKERLKERKERERLAAEKVAKLKSEKEQKAVEKQAKELAKREKLAAQKAVKDKKEQEKRLASSNLKKSINKENETLVIPKKAQIADGTKELKCPAGMILKTTARFPRGSIRRGKIKGKRAIKMAKDGKAYCIDAYEYPGRGQSPKVNVTFNGAKSLCEQANKRLCSGREWVRACKGRRGAQYPYGKKFNPSKCITEDKEGEERKRSKSGSMRSCKSASGAYDMSGNVAEWTADQRVRGGYYASYDDEATCGSGGRRSPSSKRGYIGFRCCMDFK